ncbi:glycerophosphoinositol inositolphosphodiesterase GDPD2 isoform X2 [Betta splendens]|uniref:Glycerophosphoinositol inositolphosphodiesterase GDPD2 isoform X2 n=1 Tax=Betta splendens TaxID=158456 RepID=A0A6P7NK59_BETSP|nr:glycerophosphoinositol inositolphosphodiesterase GDPD2 isoform X2 [Betta splendens]
MSALGRCCTACSRGCYSCRWRNRDNNQEAKCGCCWLFLVSLASLLSLCWMYFFLVAFNDREELNWKAFRLMGHWVNWFMVLVIVYAVISCYCVLLLVFALIQAALKAPLDLHWIHMIFLFCGLILITCGVTGISLKWGERELPVVPLSLQATGPFLQFGAVGALTLLSWLVFQSFHRTQKARSKLLIAVVFGGVSAAIFMWPCFIRSPCLMAKSDLLDKPKLLGHRGAPMLAPENTMMSFNRSLGCGVAAFETDVQVSKDREPFLMHDYNGDGSKKGEFLLRTTNVREVFPNQSFRDSASLTWKELQRLNAGEWFLKTDPFRTASQLSRREQEAARNQSVPSLMQLLRLAQRHNVSVIFDLYSPNQHNDTIDVVDTILRSGIEPSLILWLPSAQRRYVSATAPSFIQYYASEQEMLDNGGKHLNMRYSNLSTQKIRELRRSNVTVNLWTVNEPWLFSLLWCAGASSVTTNACHLLKDMERPHWTMEPREYRLIWISVDAVSVVIMAILCYIQRNAHCRCHRRASKPRFNVLERELQPITAY